MPKILNELWEHFKAHWTRATARITGGTMAAIVGVYLALGGNIPAWVVWALVALAFYVASFCVWREGMQSDKRSLVGISLGNACDDRIATGKDLLAQLSDEEPIINKAKEWVRELEAFCTINMFDPERELILKGFGVDRVALAIKLPDSSERQHLERRITHIIRALYLFKKTITR